jgi:hypothetical protein
VPAQRTIPRIFHQTSANETIPEAWKDLVKSCKETYSEFEYKVCLSWVGGYWRRWMLIVAALDRR